MSKQAHTPTPWSHVADRNFECRHLIRLDPDEPGTAEAIGDIIDPVNAAFIVVAVNQHARLIEAVDEVREALENRYDGAPDSPNLWMGHLLNILEEALR